jgi:3-hydroxyisobutyrate dehydrogenase
MSKSLRVGFVGTGIMGAPMAANCLKAGFAVTVFNRSVEKTQPLVEAGAAVADSPAAVAAASDIVCSCVTADDDVRQVVLDETTGIIAGARDGLIVVDHSTVSPGVAVECADALKTKGAGFLDAPISGGDVGAKAGTLSIMVGGEKAHFDAALPVLDVMGGTVTYCGGSGAGYTVKLCNQILGALHLVAAAEAISLAKAADVDVDAMLKAVSSGAAGSWMLSNLAPKMASGDFAPGFFIDYQLKDLKLAMAASDGLGLPLPGASLATQLMKSASALGHGRDGTQAIIAALQNLAGNG